MTSPNTDDFDQDGLESLEGGGAKKSARGNLLDAWHSKPIFKLLAIMMVVGAAVAVAMGMFSSPKDEKSVSYIGAPPNIREAPGSKDSPFFIEQSTQDSDLRAKTALQEGGSALPTPVGQNVDISDLTGSKKDDPMVEFRAESERLRQELRREQQQNMQLLQQQVQQGGGAGGGQRDDTLAQAMQRQMQQLMESWSPKNLKLVAGTATADPKVVPGVPGVVAPGGGVGTGTQEVEDRNLVEAGTVNYAQLLTEANSDVPGPILAQIVSGPLAGGRAIGSFQVMEDLLILRFGTVNLRGKDYAINALALDPDTTLGGMATEVDHRYFARVLLPAAGEFVSSFGNALAETPVSTIVTPGGAVVSLQAKKGLEEALYEGMGEAGDTLSDFLKQEGSRIRPLVRVAVGTPMGLFFTASVKESGKPSATAVSVPNVSEDLRPAPQPVLRTPAMSSYGGETTSSSRGVSITTPGVSYAPPRVSSYGR